MSRTACVVAIIFAGLAPVWGCSKPASVVNAAPFEERIAKLERDFRAVEVARAAAVARADALESRLAAEASRSAAVTRERDDLAANLKLRVAQGEVVQTQLDGLKKGLKELLGTMENVNLPATPAGVPYSLLPGTR